jgi:hypothetical protein
MHLNDFDHNLQTHFIHQWSQHFTQSLVDDEEISFPPPPTSTPTQKAKKREARPLSLRDPTSHCLHENSCMEILFLKLAAAKNTTAFDLSQIILVIIFMKIFYFSSFLMIC